GLDNRLLDRNRLVEPVFDELFACGHMASFSMSRACVSSAIQHPAFDKTSRGTMGSPCLPHGACVRIRTHVPMTRGGVVMPHHAEYYERPCKSALNRVDGM